MLFIANGVNPIKRPIVQASHLKCQLEQLKLSIIASLDIINMYPSVKAKLIRKAVAHYSQGFDGEEREVIHAALEMQKFSIWPMI